MVFKRRDPRPFLKKVADFLWPRGGWARAASYVGHRLRRLPDSPERIARGIFIGVFTAFTPFYGLHFILAVFLAKLMRANMLAALLGTFFGNPLTYVPIVIVSMKTGHFLLGVGGRGAEPGPGILHAFAGAWRDVWGNIGAIFTGDVANWEQLGVFFETVFVPYLVGGVIPGLITALICYYLSKPLISAYQNRRRKRLAAKLAQLRAKKAANAADGRVNSH